MPEELIDGVFDLTLDEEGGRRYRAYFVEDDVPTLVDTGLEETTDALEAELEDIGTPPERVIITHGDPDHLAGLETVVETYDVETWVPEETETDVAVDHRFGDGETIGPFEAVYAPGHEPDNYALVDEDAGYVIPGDALFGADLRGLPEGYLIPPPALYSADINQAEESMERLLEYDWDAALVFHGTSVLEGAYDRVDAFINFPGKPGWATYRD